MNGEFSVASRWTMVRMAWPFETSVEWMVA